MTSYLLTVVPNEGQNKVVRLIKIPVKKGKEEKKLPVSETKVAMMKEEAVEVDSEPEVFRWEQDLNSINVHNYKTFEDLLQRVALVFPLIKEGVDRSSYPHCATSLDEYLRWNIGKRRASEWKHAGLVHSTMLVLLKKHNITYFSEADVWSRSAIMSWCRRNGFVPMSNEKMTLLPEPKWSGIELCSISNPDDIISTIEEKPRIAMAEEEKDVDIIGTSDEDLNRQQPSHKPTTSLSLPHFNEASAYVKETASQIGVDIKPVELEKSFHVPIVEEVILAACRQLASDLIRSSLNEGYNRIGGQICPEEVTVCDVFSAVRNISRFDFLNNSSLGIPKEDT